MQAGAKATGMVATTVSVAVSMTLTVASSWLATNTAVAPSAASTRIAHTDAASQTIKRRDSIVLLRLRLGLEALQSFRQEGLHRLYGGVVVLVGRRLVARIGAVKTRHPGDEAAAVCSRLHGELARVGTHRQDVDLLLRQPVKIGHLLLAVVVETLRQLAGLQRDRAARSIVVAAGAFALGDGRVPVADLPEVLDDP